MARNRTTVRVTLYLPDDLRERASEAGLNLSGLLRRAVEEELRGSARGPEVTVQRDGDSFEVRVRFAADQAPQ